MNNNVLDFYAQLGPAPRGILLLILGLLIGSFSSVLLRRLPEGQAWASARSECPHCKHELGPLDLIPVLSYLLLGGRCRYCRAPISWRYPALELGCGLLAAATGAAGGWSWGFISLGAWVLGAAGWGVAKRRSGSHDQAGFTLVEVLVSLLLIGGVTAGVMEAITSSRRASLQAYRSTVAVGLAQQGLAQVYAAASSTPLGTRPVPTWTPVPGTLNDEYQVQISEFGWHCTAGNASDPKCQQDQSKVNWWDVTVTVSCSSCPGAPGPGAGLTLTTVVAQGG